jgi:hypothetical protein
MQSDLRSRAMQVTTLLSLGPSADFSSFVILPSLSYTVGSQRNQERGFDGSTAGNPLLKTWGRGGGDIRHQFQLTTTFMTRPLTVTLFGTMRSGVPFTPIVGGDINGDGYGNDRAFIPNPAATTDPRLHDGMTTLLTSLDSRTRDCLTKQFGKIADRNSCVGPWSQSLGMSFALSGKSFRLPKRMTISGYASNVLGGLDQLFHGNHLHGWGDQSYPDPVLLIPKGFDPATNQFAYDVNPRFGVQRIARSRLSSPFSMTLNATIQLGLAPSYQSANGMLRMAKTRPDSDRTQAMQMLKQWLGGGRTRMVLMTLTQQKDSLELTRAQLGRIAAIDTAYTAKSDSIVTPLVEELFKSTQKKADDALVAKIRSVQATLDSYFVAMTGPEIKSVLTPAQIAKLPRYVSTLLTSKENPFVDEY